MSQRALQALVGSLANASQRLGLFCCIPIVEEEQRARLVFILAWAFDSSNAAKLLLWGIYACAKGPG